MANKMWRKGYYNERKANANLVYDELQSIGTGTKPKDVVDYAREHPESELHKCFTWDNSKAAELWRRNEAKIIMCSIVFCKDEEKQTPSIQRAIVYTESDDSWKPLETVVIRQTEYEELLERALRELKAFEKKYAALSELNEIFALIDTL